MTSRNRIAVAAHSFLSVSMRRGSMRQAVIALIAIVSLSHAAQRIWIDKEIQFGGGRVCNVAVPGTPANFVSPDNYRDGMCYFRAECLSKPTDLRASIQLCIWAGGETCSWHTSVTFAKPGDVGASQQQPGKWWKKSGTHDWTTGSNQVCCVLKNPATNKWIDACGGSHCMGEAAKQHLPIKVRYTAIVVSQGSELELPTELGFECPEAWGCDAVSAKRSPAGRLRPSPNLRLNSLGRIELEGGALVTNMCTVNGRRITFDRLADNTYAVDADVLARAAVLIVSVKQAGSNVAAKCMLATAR
jgi:hypothetical protein